MLIWRGRGIVVALLAFGALFLAAAGVPAFLAGVIIAVPIWLLGKKWNDDEGRKDDLFFIPVKYWSIIVVVVSIVLTITPLPDPRKEAAAEPPPAPRPRRVAPPPPPAPVTMTTASAPVAPPPSTTTIAREEQPAVQFTKVRQVYADNDTKLYYPEDCAKRPANAYRLSRALAITQGFALAPGCSE